MKFSTVVAVFATSVFAQDIGSLPPCGQLCVSNMLGLAPSLGCGPTDIACLCRSANFGNGLRDCSAQACGNDVSNAVVAYGAQYCANAGASMSTDANGAMTTMATSGSNPTATDGANSMSTTGTGSIESSASSALDSASKSASSALSSASASVSNALSSLSSGINSASSSAVSQSSNGFAMPTAIPMVGAGLGALAAMLL